MAQSFIDRNKKKSSSGLALLLLKLRGLPGLVLLVAAVMLLFMMPSSLLPDLARVADITHWGRSSGAMSAADLAAQMRAARQQSSKSAWSLFSRGGAGGNSDSVGMIRGGEHDVLGAASIASKIQGGTTINGVLSPEDSRKRGANGVELSEEEARGGLVASAAAAVIPGANLLTGGRVAPAQEPGAAERLKTDKIPSGDKEKMIAGREGKLSKTEFRTLQTNKIAFEHASNVGGKGSALAVLTDARTQGQMSRAPNCTRENGCPPEYAMTRSGAVYDGHKTGRKAGSVIEAAPAVMGIDGASTPGPMQGDGKDVDSDQMEQIKQQQHDCDVSNAQYKVLMNPHVQRLVELAKQPPTPQNVMEASRECHIVDDLLRQQYNACPLRREDGPYEPQQCD